MAHLKKQEVRCRMILSLTCLGVRAGVFCHLNLECFEPNQPFTPANRGIDFKVFFSPSLSLSAIDVL